MGLTIRKGEMDHVDLLLAEINNLRVLSVGSNFHADVTSTTSGSGVAATSAPYLVSAADGDGTVATLVALCADLKLKYNAHLADAVAHKAADTTNSISTASGTTLGTCETFLNALYTKYNAHLTQTGVHYNNDSTNTASSASATTQSSADTRATDLKAKFNAHIIGAPAGHSFVLVDA